ncbi:MAG: tetratricopeptide repeat protein [Candidatus Wallbacteria bacterium]|nr:tetratricopeptide repeat protein [Candidatus Wallbacteria bacterium]
MLYILFTSLLLSISLLVYYFKFSFDVDRYFDEGLKLFRKRDMQGAMEKFLLILDVNPIHVDTNLHLAAVYSNLNMVEEAERIYDFLLEANHPQNNRNKVNIFLKKGELYWHNRRYDRAYLEFRKVLELDATDSQAHFYIAVFCAGQGWINEAFDEFRKALEIDPDYNDARLYLGLCFTTKNWLTEARREFRKILEKCPSHMMAHLFLGYLLKDDKDRDAMQEFLYIVNNDNTELRFRATNLYGITAMEQNLHSEAVALFEKILAEKTMPVKWINEIKYNLGWACMFQGNASKAVEVWNEVASTDINFYNVADLVRSFDEVDMEAMEDEWRIYSMNETIPNVESYIAHPRKFDIESLQQEFETWKRSHQELLNIRFARGLIRTAEKLALVNASALKKMGRKIVNFLKLYIEDEKVRAAGINYYATASTAKKQRVVVFLRNWQNIVGEGPIFELVDEMRRSNAVLGVFVICGLFSREAKNLAKDNKIKLIGKKALDRMLLEL